MNTTMKGFVAASGATLMALTSFGFAAAQQANAAPPEMEVENLRNVPVVAYLERGPFDVRLGTVPPHQTEDFALPPYLEDGEDVQAFVHPEGGVDLATRDFTVHSGGVVTLLVPVDNEGDVPGPAPEVIENPGPESATVTVQNDMKSQVTIFMDQGQYDIRLGTIPPGQERTLTLPKWIVQDEGSVELFAHPEGGLDFATRTFQVYPGAHLLMQLPPVS